jgi:HSP20 family protein
MLRRFMPRRDFLSLRDEIDRLFESFFEEPLWPRTFEHAWSPAIDVYETDSEIVVKAELPGMKAEDVEVTLAENRLTLKGEKKRSEETKGENYYRMESVYGSFLRTIPIPVPVKKDEIKATFKDGVLEIRLKKDEVKEKSLKIDVKEE